MNLLRERTVTAESIFDAALQDLHRSPSDVPPALREAVLASIRADLSSRSKKKTLTHIPRDSETALQGVKSSAMLHLVLTKKVALMLASELRKADENNQPTAHNSPSRAPSVMKSSVERIHAKHQREAAWGDQIQRDQAAFHEEQDRLKELRLERMKLQRTALDAQVERQRDERHKRQQSEAEELQRLLESEKESLKADAEKKKGIMDAQAARRREADSHARQQAADRRAQVELEKKIAIKESQLLQAAEAAAKQDAHRRKMDQKQSIRRFVEENERLLEIKRHSLLQRDGTETSSSPLPSPSYKLAPLDSDGGSRHSPVADEEEKQKVRLQQQLLAAEVYSSMMASNKQSAMDRQRQADRRYLAEITEREHQAALRRAKAAANNVAVREALKQQIQEHEDSVARERDEELQLRKEMQANVVLGDVEARRVRRIEQKARGRNLQYIEHQISLQKAMRSAFDVTPKI